MTSQASPDAFQGFASAAAAKAHLRSAALARRGALDAAARAQGSAAVCRAVLALPLPARAAISAYVPIRGEVDLMAAVDGLVRRGHPLGLPVMAGGALVFRRYHPGMALVPLGMGTFGPGAEAEEIVPDAMLMPLAAFDRHGGRIGYGRAFYDRTIAALSVGGCFPRLIGVAFSVQEVEAVPMEPHDKPLHEIITEKGVLRPA